MRARFAVAVACSSVAAACAPSEPEPGALLNRYWPAHAHALRVATDGAGDDFRLVARFPPTLGQAVELLDRRGDRWQITEPTCGAGEERLHTARSYRCDWGHSIWRATPAGAEEWLMLPDGAEVSRLSWRIDGGRLVQHGRSVDVIDDFAVPHATFSALAAFDSTGRAVGARLRVHGQGVQLSLDEEVEGPLLIDPAFVPAGSMAAERCNFSATLLADGRVLAADGVNNTAANIETKTAELWDPLTRTWSAAAPTKWTHSYHAATLLPDGSVLLTGGSSYQTTERYDPASDQWSQPPQCTDCGHPAVRLLDGSVLVMAYGNAQRFDPTAGSWSSTAPPPGVNSSPQALVRLQDGHVFAYPLSGWDAATYDPKGDVWDLLPKPKYMHSYMPVVLLKSGKVLFAGGNQIWAETYDPVAKTWTTSQMLTKRELNTAETLPDGTVVMAGGTDTMNIAWDSSELYDETTNKWSSGPSMAVARYSHSMVNLGGGKVLVVGGQNKASSELFGPGNADGVACKDPSECTSGYCVDGVCCDSKCAGGQCVVCSAAKGAEVDGRCTKASFVPCDADGNACTVDDTCSAGVCKSGKPKICGAQDQCHVAGTCDASTGMCTNPPAIDGYPCQDGDPCTVDDTCQSGVCTAGVPLKCPPDEICHEAHECDHKAGVCFDPPPKPKGTPCDDGDPCTMGESCNSGKCAGQPVECPVDQCHLSAWCSSDAGGCVGVVKPDGAPCDDGNPCTHGDSCQQGQCLGGPSDGCTSATTPPIEPVILNGRGGGACSAGGAGDAGDSPFAWLGLLPVGLVLGRAARYRRASGSGRGGTRTRTWTSF